jgi:cell volume regulation protein A
VARRLRVTAPTAATELLVESAPLERMRADLLRVEVPIGSRLNGVYLDELRLPLGAAVTLVLRDGTGFVPDQKTRLRQGDSLLVVSTAEVRDAAERRLHEVSRYGRLARWRGQQGPLGRS